MHFVYVKLPFSGAFVKLRKATISFNISLSVSPHWTTWLPLNGFSCSDIWGFFENLSRQFKLHYNLTRITGTLHEDLCTFVVIPRWILPRLRNVSDKRCRKNQNTHFMFNDFFIRKSCRLWDNVKKYVTFRQATNDNIMRLTKYLILIASR